MKIENPKDEYIKVLKDTLFKLGMIDECTPWQEVEPQWWLDMMQTTRTLQDALDLHE
jgi:hypothetical protein